VPYQLAYRSGVASPDQPPTPFDEQTERRWPDPDEGPYLLTIYWRRRPYGRLDPIGLTLLPEWVNAAEPPTLLASLLRELRLAEIAAEDRETLPHVPAGPREPEEVIEGMRPATVRRLHRAADLYQEAFAAGDPPTRAVAVAMNLTAPAAANLVRRAREAGLLPPTSAGVPQG
jgi:hypothetical protein